MTYIVFEKDTKQSTIDWHVKRNRAQMFYDGIPPKWEARAIEEGWTFPHVGTETDDVP